jgi:hypothetical protein
LFYAVYSPGIKIKGSGGDKLGIRRCAGYVSQMYALQRFVTACAGRGAYPIKYNGSIFTVPSEGAPGDADYRRWGPGYWWQNTRLPYLALCASGDFEHKIILPDRVNAMCVDLFDFLCETGGPEQKTIIFCRREDYHLLRLKSSKVTLTRSHGRNSCR